MNPERLFGASWRTSLCALLGGLFTGLSQMTVDPAWQNKFAMAAVFMANVGNAFARDNRVTSEQAMAKTGGGGPSGPPSVLSNLQAFALAFLLGMSLPIVSGCASILPGNDPLVVRAEQAEKTVDATFDAYVHIELANRDALKKVDIKFEQVADKIRVEWPGWLARLDHAILAYRKSHSPEDKTEMATALAVVESNEAEAKALIASAATNSTLIAPAPAGH